MLAITVTSAIILCQAEGSIALPPPPAVPPYGWSQPGGGCGCGYEDGSEVSGASKARVAALEAALGLDASGYKWQASIICSRPVRKL